jgi:MoxR-like ATPase
MRELDDFRSKTLARQAEAEEAIVNGDLEAGRGSTVVSDDRHLQQPDRSEDHQDPEGDDPVVLGAAAVPADQESDGEQNRIRAEGVGQDDGEHGGLSIIRQMPEARQPESVAVVREGLGQVGYLADEAAALVSFLAQRLGKPVLVEGPAGVGKTELAKALSRFSGRRLIRLQCYEGLDEAKALYEWNYRKQLLRIQAESGGDEQAGWEKARGDIFSDDFLLTRPLLEAISAEDAVVLLIDEIDKTDQEFEAMLLEVLSEFQISIPELGVIEARTRPIVVLTSNNSRELTEALKRRCLYLWLDYPSVERELEIVRLHAPELDEGLARQLVEIVHMVRQLDLKKPPSIAESIDWARTLLLIGADDIDRETFESSMSILVKHRSDIDTVAERVSVKLAEESAAEEPAGPGS